MALINPYIYFNRNAEEGFTFMYIALSVGKSSMLLGSDVLDYLNASSPKYKDPQAKPGGPLLNV